MSDLEARQKRTDEKIKFALIHLEELQEYEHSAIRKREGDGGPWQVAHQESYLFHLWGALDAFLQELNVHYGLNFSQQKVGSRKFYNDLSAISPEMREIRRLKADKTSWLGVMKEMRHHPMHRARLARKLTVSKGEPSEQYLKHPLTNQDSSEPVLLQFKNWHSEMSELIGNLRKQLQVSP